MSLLLQFLVQASDICVKQVALGRDSPSSFGKICDRYKKAPQGVAFLSHLRDGLRILTVPKDSEGFQKPSAKRRTDVDDASV